MKYLSAFLLALVLTCPIYAQSWDTAADGDTSNSDPSTLTITVGANSNRALYIFHAMMGTTNVCTTASADFNGDAATKIAEVGASIGTMDEAYLSLWRVIAPDTGSHTVTVNISSCSFDGYTRITAFSVYNIDQTTPNGTCATTSAISGVGSAVNVSSSSGNLVIDGIAATGAPTTTAGAGQTDRSSLNRIDGSSMTATSGLTTMSWALSDGSFGHAQIGCGLTLLGGGGGGSLPIPLLTQSRRRN